MDGTWTATDSLQRVMSLTLTQRGDSIYGAGEWPLSPGFPFALDTLTLVRALH